MKYFYSILFLFVAIATSAQGIKDSLFKIEEVPIYGKKFFKPENAGMKQTSVDSLVLIKKISVSLSDLLSENTSVFIKSSGRGALATASFRGTAASHTQVLWNGIGVNSPMTGMVDFSLIPVCFIDDMVLKHGAASIADNSGGLGGSISIANAVNWQNKLSARYSQGIGSYKTFEEFVDISYGMPNFQGRTRVFHNYSANDYTYRNMRKPSIDANGNFDFPTDTNKNAGYLMYGLLQELYWRINAEDVLSVKYWGQSADRAIPTVISYEGDVNSNINNQCDADHRVVSDFRKYTDFGRFLFRGGYSVKNLDYLSENLIVGVGMYPTVSSKSRQSNYLLQLNYTQRFSSDISVQADISANYYDVSSMDSISHQGYSKNRFETSLYLMLSKNFADRLHFNIVLRQNYVDREFIPVMPFLGFDFRLMPDVDLFLKGNIARNYHQPSLNDMYWIPGGNPDLKPEEGFSFEFGVEYQLRTSLSVFTSELTYYRTDIDNWVVWLPNFKGYWEAMNIKRVLSQGLEYSLKANGRRGEVGYRFVGTFSYSKSINYGDRSVWGDESYGKQLVYVPLYSGNLLMNLEYEGFYITYQFNSFSERYTTSSNEITTRRKLYPYFMNDVYLGKNMIIGKLSANVEFRVYNLLNERYHSELFRPMPRRHFMLQCTFKI